MHSRFVKKSSPGYRNPLVSVAVSTKAPKMRFKIGERFHYQDTTWEIIYAYRMADEPGVWVYCLEEQHGRPETEIDRYAKAQNAVNHNRIAPQAFRDHNDVHAYFSNIWRNGDAISKTTQDLLKLKKVGP